MIEDAYGPDDIVGEVMNAGGAVLREFLLMRMYCPGCPMAALMTLEEAAREHQVPVETLLERLNRAREAQR